MLRKIIYLSNGLKIISSWGSKINDERSAIIIARLVKIPKYILGIKLENTKIQKPTIIVTEV